MDAQEIEVEGGDRDKRVDSPLFKALIEISHEASHGLWCLGCGNRVEPYALTPVGILFDDVAVVVLVLSSIPDFSTHQGMKSLEDELEGLGVS